MRRNGFPAPGFFLLCLVAAPASAAPNPVRDPAVLPAAPDARVVELAHDAVQCAIERGYAPAERLAVIDYSRPSSEPRLWVYELATGKLLYEELVAHGRNSGDNSTARSFSNREGSLQTSLGLFRTLDTFDGAKGYALRLAGLEPGVNDNALQRGIIMHGASYVSFELARSAGFVGRSWGCPAVRTAIARPMIDALKTGQYLFAYYPDPQWLASSPFLTCGKTAAAHGQATAPTAAP